MGEKRSYFLQKPVKTYLQPVVRVYKNNKIKKVRIFTWNVEADNSYKHYLDVQALPQSKETLWLIRKENERKIVIASWSEMLDNSSPIPLKRREPDSIYTEHRDLISNGQEETATTGEYEWCCSKDEIQLIISYICITLATVVLLPISYWIVWKIYL